MGYIYIIHTKVIGKNCKNLIYDTKMYHMDTIPYEKYLQYIGLQYLYRETIHNYCLMKLGKSLSLMLDAIHID